MTGDGRATQVIVLSAIAALIGILCAIVWIGAERNSRELQEAVGIATVPPPDRGLANRGVRAPNLQEVLGDPGNYPEDARDRGEQGSVAAMLSIAPTGAVEQCRIMRSSGSTRLDTATCALARDKVRLEPARNAEGVAVSGSFVLRMRWVLPEE